jgi:MFS family permease
MQPSDSVPGGVPGRLRDDADFRRYWWSRVLSLVGTLISYVALPVLVYRLSGSAFLTALVAALEALPYLLFGLFAGVASDRLDRKAVMVVADLVNAALVLTVPVAYWLGWLTVPHVLVVAFVIPAIAVFFDGANFGALPMLVGRGRIAEANSAVWGAQTVVEIVIPSMVGVGLAVVSPASMLAVDAASYLVSASFIVRIRRDLHDSNRVRAPLGIRTLFREIGEGLRFLGGHAGVRTMTVIGTIQCVAGGGFVALMVVWCDQVLGIGTEGLRFGLVYASWSLGALVASIGLPRLLRRASAARIALTALPASAVLGVTAALAPTWQLAALGLLLWSGAYMLVVVNSISYRQEVTPEALMGRVNTAGRMLSWGVGWSLGAALGGLLGHVIGIHAALVVMTGFGFVAVAFAWASPLRGLARGSAVAAEVG